MEAHKAGVAGAAHDRERERGHERGQEPDFPQEPEHDKAHEHGRGHDHGYAALPIRLEDGHSHRYATISLAGRQREKGKASLVCSRTSRTKGSSTHRVTNSAEAGHNHRYATIALARRKAG